MGPITAMFGMWLRAQRDTRAHRRQLHREISALEALGRGTSAVVDQVAKDLAAHLASHEAAEGRRRELSSLAAPPRLRQPSRP